MEALLRFIVVLKKIILIISFFQEPSIVRDAFPHPSLARNINTGFDILDIDTTM